ncbi:MAG TPA: fibronectin-binding domain-containing protein [Oceanithermus profundus]|uniref:Fibronectin-binding domain-containing protein n=1 Tax=Oceanithermus profundus TaxID=187137 RepID=A0A7C5WVT1_9DEIN|nr:fibronectin-binding domain-containing protein [Oceanithermus profundus]
MEGLQIAAVLRELPERPRPTRGWRFPAEDTAVLALAGGPDLVLRYRPPSPELALTESAGGGPARTPFQKQLAARARGPLVRAEQLKLDRVVVFEFGGEEGFVDVPPVRLVFELTGRNANLILTDLEGRILGVDRVVTPEQNRYRQVRPGLTWTPPPPYEKLDPRTLEEGDLAPLLGRPLARALVQTVDGVGPRLAAEAAHRAGLEPDRSVRPEDLPRLRRAFASLESDPTPSREARTPSWREETEAALRKPLLAALERRKKTLERRLEDYARARSDLAKAERWQRYGDLLLAYAHQIPAHAKRAVLEDWESGEPVEIALGPALSPSENAERYYRRAKRARARAERAEREAPRTRRELEALEREIEAVRQLPLPELQRRLREQRPHGTAGPGLRLEAPGGFEVWVGRNRRENDWLTRSAHSGDVWMHAQGVPGSHVIVRARGKPVPLETLLFAARLAAYHSRARGEKNVPVDYTLKKHVWRPKGAAPGEVLYTQAKTLFVDAEAPEY